MTLASLCELVDWQVLVDAIGLGAVYALMAVGIGLVFGVLRLVNFAYGQLIMAGAYALAFASAVGLAALGGDRPLLRGRDRALARDGPRRLPAAPDAVARRDARRDLRRRVPAPEHRAARVRAARQAGLVARLPQPARHDRLASTSARSRSSRSSSPPSASCCVVLLLERTTRRAAHARGCDGLPHGPAARRRANRVIGSAVLISALLAATVSVILTVQNPLVTPDFALARHDRRARRRRRRRHEPAADGDARRLRDRLRHRPARRRAPDRPEPVPAVASSSASSSSSCSSARTGSSPEGRHRWSAYERRARSIQLGGPVGARRGRGARSAASPRRSTEIYFVNALVAVAIVVALYVFVGNSGVALVRPHQLRRGRRLGGRRALGARSPRSRRSCRTCSRSCATTRSGTSRRCSIAAGVGGVYALLVGLPLMRLSGLAAGIATFGVLEITHNLLRYYEKIGPGSNTFSSVPETTDLLQAALGALLVIGVAFGYQSSRFGRLLRATREDPAAARAVGVSVYRQRLIAFTLSGRARRLRRRALRPPAADQHRDGVPRSHVHHAGDARDRRHDEPLGSGRRGARRQRARLAARRGRERARCRRALDRPAGRHAARRRRRAHGARPDPAPERASPAAAS